LMALPGNGPRPGDVDRHDHRTTNGFMSQSH
jgi:hypothetical protein